MRLSAAVMATAAAVAGTFAAFDVSAATHAVRAEVVVAREGQPLAVRQIRVVDGLRPGESYRLPVIGIRNQRGLRTTYRLVVAGAARNWLRFVPARVLIDAGRSRTVALRLDPPHEAEPGVYAVTIAVRPGGSGGARLTFSVEPAGMTGWGRRPAVLTMWIVAAVAGAILLGVHARIGA